MPRLTKLTQDQIDQIRSNIRPASELASEYGISKTHVYNVRNGHYLRPPGTPAPAKRAKGRPRKHFPQACQCGCGEMTSPGRHFRQGHSSRINGAINFTRDGCVSWSEVKWLQETLKRCKVTDRGFASPCLIWQGGINARTGYSHTTYHGRHSTRHRLLYGILHPEIDLSGRTPHVHHVCEQRDCLAVWHLQVLDAAPHLQHHKSPLTQADVDEMRRLHASGVRMKEIHRLYPQMGYSSICHVVTKARWKPVEADKAA